MRHFHFVGTYPFFAVLFQKIQRSLVESDDSCGDSLDEYIPNSREESTEESNDNDCSIEISLEKTQSHLFFG